MEVCEYGRGLAIFGDTRPVKDHIKQKYSGKFNKFLLHPVKNVKEAGWIVGKDHLDTLLKDSGMRLKLIKNKGGGSSDKKAEKTKKSSNSLSSSGVVTTSGGKSIEFSKESSTSSSVATITSSTSSSSTIKAASPPALTLIDYSTKSIALFGPTKPLKKVLMDNGGRFNSFLSFDGGKQPGWIFPMTMKQKIAELVSVQPQESKTSTPGATELIEKQGIAIEPVAKSKPKALLARLSASDDHEKAAVLNSNVLIGKKRKPSEEDTDDDEPLVQAQKLG